MAFINTIDVLGDDAVFDSIIDRTISEFADDKVTVLRERIFQACTKLQSVNLPNVQHYNGYAFRGCTALTDVSLPELVDSVYGTYAQGLFYGCTALQTLRLPKLTTVNNNLFFGCTNLSTLELPVATSFGLSAAENCKALTVVDFPLMAHIGNRAFYGCTALKSLVLRNVGAVCTLGSNPLGSTPIEGGTGYVYAPSALIDAYKADSTWATYANQFRKLEEWTVDGTVTGALDIENRHMVRFFHEDGTFLGYVIVPTGGNAVYPGDDPVKEGEWVFKGWSPEPTNIVADMDCYAQFKSTALSWEDVLDYIADGTYKDNLAIGDIVPLDLGVEGVAEMQIVAFDADDKADGTGKAAITWISKDVLANTHRYNPALVAVSTNVYQEGTGTIGGWEKSELRTYCKETIKHSIRADVRNAIVPVTKYSRGYTTTGSVVYEMVSTEDLWLPSVRELCFQSIEEPLGPEYTEAFPTYTSAGKSRQYFTRTCNATTSVISCRTDGKGTGVAPQAESYIVIGFCT